MDPHRFPRNRTSRVDERDTIFSRYFMSPGREEAYYQAHPDRKERDNLWKKLPGLLSEQSAYFNPLAFASAAAMQPAIDALRFEIDGDVAPNRKETDPNFLQEYIRRWAAKMHAIDTGFCLLKPEHLYTVRGRHHYYGDPVETTHTYAIAFVVEMDREFTLAAPQAPVIMESYRQYLNAGVIAVQVASLLRSFGWEAKAHIDSNYEVICPPVARDAGLGEIGRMGVLLSRKVGPRCRISVVTTTFPFPVDPVQTNDNPLFFCEICRKCAENCPAHAIPETPYSRDPATAGWKINGERCFTFWCKAGTDCARCMAVCPFSHPDTFFHRMVRIGISRSKLFARAAFHLDNLFYGKRPPVKSIPEWMRPLNH
ncbi:MAG: hypothetical protein IH596_11030 [Bacteroidales bacterium]|nr:hypothetical protein [Bacteroidales bacterium]